MATAANADDRAFLGHPKGVAYLSFTEAWERSSYYGMTALLVLFMTKQLLLPGHVEQIVGWGPARWCFEHVYGGGKTMTVVALASAVYGFYSSSVYLTPILGGLLADRIGRTRTIIIGGVVMAAGHFLMAFDQSFLLALFCLLIGCGCLKGNIAAQVGLLYSAEDKRRADGYQIYYVGISLGGIFGPMVSGYLGEGIAWHYGFGAAGVGMLLSLVIYLSGVKYMPKESSRTAQIADRAERPRFTPREVKAVILLVCLLPILALTIVGNNQIFNSYLVWAEAKADLHLFGVPILTSQMVGVDAFVSVITLVGMVAFWRVWKTRFPEPDELGKMVIGCVISALGVTCLALGQALTPMGGKVAFGWLLLFHLLNDIGFANVLPVGLALFARAAPRQIAGMMIGVYYIHLWGGNQLVGILGTQYEKMAPVQFWLLHAGLVGGGGLLLLIVRQVFGGLLMGAPAEPEPVLADAGRTP